MSNELNKSNNFDLLRLIFACLVFLYHSTVLFGYKTENILFNLPHLAVQGFFIISGFLIVWSFDRNKDILQYSIKRFFRIYPLYFFIIVTQAAIMTILPNSFNFSNIIKYLISNLTFLNFLSPSIGTILNHLKIDAINGSLWTLKIEVVFYILLPVIYFLYKKFGRTFLLILYLFSACYCLLVKDPFFSVLFPIYLRFFIIGILLYFYGLKLINFLKNNKIMVISLFIIFLFADIFIKNDVFKSFIYPISLGMTVLISAFCLPYKKLPLDISYGVYVIHFPVVQLLMLLNVLNNNYKLFLLLSGVIVFALSILSAIFIEKPYISLGHNLSKKYNVKYYNIKQKLPWKDLVLGSFMLKNFKSKLED